MEEEKQRAADQLEEEQRTDYLEKRDSFLTEEKQKAIDQQEEEDALLEEEQKATDQMAKEDSLLKEVEEEQRVADQLAEEELIERQGEFMISVLGEINMLLSISSVRVIRMHMSVYNICPQILLQRDCSLSFALT